MLIAQEECEIHVGVGIPNFIESSGDNYIAKMVVEQCNNKSRFRFK